MPMPGHTTLGAFAAYMAMWMAMMVTMMLPSLAPTLWRSRRDALSLGIGFYVVWAAVGAALYPLAFALTAAQSRWPGLLAAVPVASGIVLVLAGCTQLTAWKAHHLDCCRAPAPGPRTTSSRAWRAGLRLGGHCALCCAGFMTFLLVMGMGRLAWIVVVATAITIERVAPWPRIVARAAGIAMLASGVLLTMRALVTS